MHPLPRLVPLLVASALTLRAQTPAAAPGPVLRCFAEEEPIKVEEAWEEFRDANAGLLGGVTPRTVSFADALKTARALAAKAGGKDVLAGLRAKFAKPEPAELYRLGAVRETMLGHPSAALVLLVGVLDLRPDDADTLFNLAGVLAGLGYANEALAILDELARRGVQPRLALGLAPADAADYLRGYCLARRGDHAGARRLLEPIHARQPLLAEAPRLLALLDDAEEKNPRKNFLLGVWRRNTQRMVCAGVDVTQPEPDADTTGDEVAIDVRSFIELHKGKPGKLPNVQYATTPDSCKAMRELVEKLKREADAASSALIQQRQAVKPRGYKHTEEGPEEVWGYRMEQLLTSLDYRDAKLRNLDRARREADRAAKAAYDKAIQEASDGFAAAYEKEARARIAARRPAPGPYEMGVMQRPFLEAAMNAVDGPYRALEKAHRDWFAEWHLLATALAGRVGDPRWREVFRLRIETQRQFAYGRILHCADMHAATGISPFLEAKPPPAQEGTEEQGLGECDNSTSVGVGISRSGFGEAAPFNLGVSATCDGLSLEAGLDVLPGLSLSAEVGVDTKGQITAFVGPMQDASIAGTGFTAKEGFYVSGNRHGVQEAGVMVETRANVNAGGVGVSRQLSSTAVNFLPGPQTSPPGGLSPYVAGE